MYSWIALKLMTQYENDRAVIYRLFIRRWAKSITCYAFSFFLIVVKKNEALFYVGQFKLHKFGE